MSEHWNSLREARREWLTKPLSFTFSSWIPEKYELHDTETGEVWSFKVVRGAVTTYRKAP